MGMRRTYGNTWWGAQWLRALERVDHANRLPRGKTYCTTGRIAQCEWNPTTLAVEALIDGSAYFPYEVSIAMERLNERKAKQLIDAIARDPELVAQLLDDQLPEKTAELCESLGIELFPSSWRQMRLACTCPDSAHVCKHIAALFYKLADMIDADPFLIFKLRGVDLKAELKARGIDVEQTVTARAPEIGMLLDSAAGGRPDKPILSEEAALEALRSLPYPALPRMKETLRKLLPESLDLGLAPRMREALLAALERAGREARKARERAVIDESRRDVEGEEALDDHPGRQLVTAAAWRLTAEEAARNAFHGVMPESWRFTIAMGWRESGAPDLAAWRKVVSKQQREASERVSLLEEDKGNFFRRLLLLSAKDVRELPPEAECWREITLAASQLLTAGAVVPALAAKPEDPSGKASLAMPRLFWTPALRTSEVAELFDALCDGCGPWTGRLFESGTVKAGPAFVRESVYLALSAAISGLVWEFAGRSAKQDNLFLLDGLCGDVSFADGRFPEEAQRALERYFRAFLLSDLYPWRPVLTARVAQDGVKLNFGILAKNADARALAAIEAEETSPEGDAAPAVRSGAAQRAEGKAPARPIMLKRLLENPAYTNDRFAALSILKTLAEAYPELDRIRETGGKPATIETAQMKDFLFEAAPVLTLLGVAVMLPASLKRLLKPRLIAQAGLGKSSAKSVLSKDALGAFEWKAALGSRVLTSEELAQLMAHSGEVVRIGDDFVYVDPDELARMAKLMDSPQPSFLEKMRAVLTGEYEGAEVLASAELKARLSALTAVEDVPPPAGLAATLRPYQQRGYAWLMKNLRLGLGALIADDMGLGKTLQVIAAVAELKAEGELDNPKKGKALAVVPATLLTNWVREIGKFAPHLTAGVYHGASRTLPPADALPDVTITSYGTLRRDAELLAARRWRLLILDEAQAVKNASSAQSTAVRAVKAASVIAMTGTPVENRLMEYWAIFAAVQPRLLGSASDFQKTFAVPIESEHDSKAVDAFRRLTAPFMLRRLKSDKSIIADLPERTTQDRFTTLTPEQTALYAKVLGELMQRIEKAEEAEKSSANPAEAKTARRGLVLKLIMSLKQICNSPSQFLKKPAARPDSGKAAALLEILDACREAERKVLIFTQFREMGELLQNWIEAATGERPDFLHGGATLEARAKMVDRFQTDRSVHAMIVSLRAGGTGLNLTAASAVVHYDLWWNPAVEQQATDRAYRIGQRRDVLVWRFVTQGTFEERINEMLAQKRELADLTVATGETWIGDLSASQIEKLFALDRAAAQG